MPPADPSGATGHRPGARYLPTATGWLVGGSAAAVGVGLVVLGGLLDSDSYGASVLANVGTALLLVLPLVLLERAVEVRLEEAREEVRGEVRELGGDVDDVRERVDELDGRLADLTRRTEQRGDRVREADLAKNLQPVDAIVERLTYRSVRDALLHAHSLGAVGREVYLPLRERPWVLRLGLAHRQDEGEQIWVRLLSADTPLPRRGRRVPLRGLWGHSHWWSSPDTVEDMVVELNRELHRDGGSDARQLDAGALVAQLVETLRVGVHRSAGAGPRRGPALLALVSVDWVLLSGRLEHATDASVGFDVATVMDQVAPPVVAPDLPGAADLPHAWRVARRCWYDVGHRPST